MLGILIAAGILALPVLWAGARWLYDVRAEARKIRELLLAIGELPDDVEAFNAEQAEEALSTLERFEQLPAASPLDYPQVHRLEERRDVLMKIRERVSTEGTAPPGHHANEEFAMWHCLAEMARDAATERTEAMAAILRTAESPTTWYQMQRTDRALRLLSSEERHGMEADARHSETRRPPLLIELRHLHKAFKHEESREERVANAVDEIPSSEEARDEVRRRVARERSE